MVDKHPATIETFQHVIPLKHLETTECDVGDVGGLWSLIPSSLPQLHQLSNRLNPFTRLQAKPFLRKEVRIFPIVNVFVFFPLLQGFGRTQTFSSYRSSQTWRHKKKWSVEVAGSMAWHSGKHIRIKHATNKFRWTTWEANVRSTKIQKKSKHILYLYVCILIHPKK